MSTEEQLAELENSVDNVQDGSGGAGVKRSKKKKSKKKGKKFIPLPVLNNLDGKLPWVTNFTQKMGRHAVARRPICAGEVVLMERAVAAIPREQYHFVICHGCLRKLPENKMAMNPTGQNRMFCSVECEGYASKFGAASELIAEIPELSVQHNCDPSLLELIAKLGATKQNQRAGQVHEANCAGESQSQEFWQEESESSAIIHGGWDDVMTLVSHWERMDEGWRKSVTAACKALETKYMKHGLEPVPLQELQGLAAIVNMNSHGLGATGSENTDVALGLFPVLSLLNHSCRPNCCFNGDGPIMSVRAICDIKSGEQLCVTYINLMEPRWLRQKMLLDTRFFQCSCPRCSEELFSSTDRLLEGVQCPKKKCQGLHIAKRDPSSCDNIVESRCTTCDMVSYPQNSIVDPVSAVRENQVVESSVENEEKKPKENKRGKLQKAEEDLSGFKPQEVITQAHESLTSAMASYGQKNTRDALALFEKHVMDFERKGRLGQYHVCIFDALTPIMNCYRRLGDAQGSLKYCQKVIHCMETVLDLPTVELGNFYKCMGEVLVAKTEAKGLSKGLRNIYRKQELVERRIVPVSFRHWMHSAKQVRFPEFAVVPGTRPLSRWKRSFEDFDTLNISREQTLSAFTRY